MNHTNPREFAKYFIERYVKRGDSLESLVSGQGGYSYTGFSVNIGGYAVLTHGSDDITKWESIKINSDEIVVTEYNNEECFEKFKLADLFNEIRSGNEQFSLFYNS